MNWVNFYHKIRFTSDSSDVMRVEPCIANWKSKLSWVELNEMTTLTFNYTARVTRRLLIGIKFPFQRYMSIFERQNILPFLESGRIMTSSWCPGKSNFQRGTDSRLFSWHNCTLVVTNKPGVAICSRFTHIYQAIFTGLGEGVLESCDVTIKKAHFWGDVIFEQPVHLFVWDPSRVI